MTWDREAAERLIERAKREPWSLPLETRLQLMLQDAVGEVDRLTATIAAANAVLDAAKVGPCSTLGSRVEMLAQERDRMLAVRGVRWIIDARSGAPIEDSRYVEGWNDALDAVRRAGGR